MNENNLKQLVAQALAAMKAGSDVAARVTAEISGDVTHAGLKAALEEGNRGAQQWSQRIDRARQQVGDAAGPGENAVMEAIVEVSRRIRRQAPDAVSRDLGIIADGQFALHYWTAAFGTVASYANALGMEEVAGEMKKSADEAKAADTKHTALAQQILTEGGPAGMAG